MDEIDKNVEKPVDKKPRIPNPRELQKEFQEMVTKKFGGQVQVFSLDDQKTDVNEELASELPEVNPVEEFSFTPKEIKTELDSFVVGQDEVKKALAISICDHYNHLKAELDGDILTNYQKQNILIVGPTGVGKTYLVRLIAKLIGVPFVKADATRFSEVGYMGANVDDIIRDLVTQAKGNKALAEQGIVYVDEADKMASARSSQQKDVNGRGVQFGFLRLLEDSEVDLNSSHDITSQFKTLMSFQKKGKADKEIVRTKNILFIFSGAFTGLDEVIKKRLNQGEIGLNSGLKSENLLVSEWMEKVESEDFVEFGFEQEFIGRLPVHSVCHNLSADDLYEILMNKKSSVVYQYIRAFGLYGIRLSFTKGALKKIAEKASTQKTGARALMQICESLLRDFKFELPSTEIRDLKIDAAVVANPKGYLHHLLSK